MVVRLVSSIQAVISCIVGYIIATGCQGDIMKDSHWLTSVYLWCGLPYLVYDIWAMYTAHCLLYPHIYEWSKGRRLWHYVFNNALLVIHHVGLPLVFLPIVLYYRREQGDFFIGVLLMVEVAVPFLASRNILVQLKMKETRLYIITGLSMVFVFIVSRILVFPFLYWKYSSYSSIPFLTVPFKIPLMCNFGCVIILLPQLYWLSLMIRGVYRVFFSKSSSGYSIGISNIENASPVFQKQVPLSGDHTD